MLQTEIETAQHSVKTDAYQMSVGEIINMYRDKELVINPDFQRLFRWGLGQKSKLVESILLGIPLPPIFVYEKEDSTWELIDGLQRISTILEFMGLLRNHETGEARPPSSLSATKYLPSLHNTVWEISDKIPDLAPEDQVELDKSQQLALRRARIGVEILKRPSDNKTKFDLFQRLNAGGTPANAQELRNCIAIMVSNGYYNFIKDLADYKDFRTVLAATTEQVERQRHMEYASRFLVHTQVAYDGKRDVEDYIDEGIIQLAEKGPDEAQAFMFENTFKLLDLAFGDNALRRVTNNGHQGRVSLAAFECIAVGIGINIQDIMKIANPVKFIQDKVFELWASPNLNSFFSPGLRGTARIQRTVPFGSALFAP